MQKLLLLSFCVSIAMACGSSANYTGANAGAIRSNSAVAKTNGNTNGSSLKENSYTSAGNSSLGTLLRPSVGKTVSEIKLWQNNEIDTRLKKLMGADYATMKKFWNTEKPINKFGDFLMMIGCEEHNCVDNQYVIVMDTSNGILNVVHIGKDVIREWKEHRDIDLPPPFADQLAALKSRK